MGPSTGTFRSTSSMPPINYSKLPTQLGVFSCLLSTVLRYNVFAQYSYTCCASNGLKSPFLNYEVWFFWLFTKSGELPSSPWKPTTGTLAHYTNPIHEEQGCGDYHDFISDHMDIMWFFLRKYIWKIDKYPIFGCVYHHGAGVKGWEIVREFQSWKLHHFVCCFRYCE